MTTLSALMLLSGLLAQQPDPAPANPLDGVLLPAKTDIFISLQRSLNSKTASAGDKFSATVDVPVTQNDEILIPAGSWIIGHVVYKQDPGRFKGKAQLQLAFDTVILPDGTTRLLQAAVTSADGAATPAENEDGTIEASSGKGGKIAAGTVQGGVTGAVTGAIVGVIRGGAGKSIGIGSAVGAATGAALALLQRGEDVELPKGAGLTIQLQDAVVFVKPEPAARGQVLKP